MPYKFSSVTSSKTKMSQKAFDILMVSIAGNDKIEQVVLPTRISD